MITIYYDYLGIGQHRFLSTEDNPFKEWIIENFLFKKDALRIFVRQIICNAKRWLVVFADGFWKIIELDLLLPPFRSKGLMACRLVYCSAWCLCSLLLMFMFQSRAPFFGCSSTTFFNCVLLYYIGLHYDNMYFYRRMKVLVKGVNKKGMEY